MTVTAVSRERLQTLRDQEMARFAEMRPQGSAALKRAKSTLPGGVPMSWMSTGPAIGIQTTAENVDRYLQVLDDFLAALQ